MSTMSHGSSSAAQERRPSWLVPEMWASLAITAMWVAVFVTALWGPDAEFHSVD